MANRVVFVDESFYEWFGLPKEESNFCYAAISVPERRLHQLTSFMSAFTKQLVNLHEADTGMHFPGGEVKSKFLYELTSKHRQKLAQKLGYFLRKNDGYIFTFYTTSQAFIHNLIRDKYYREYGKEYADFLADADAEMVAVREKLVASWKEEPFNLALLKPLYTYLISFVWTFHRERRETFRIQYDPREPGEDIALNLGAADAIEMYDGALEKMGEAGLSKALLGFDASLSSTECPGLQLADFVAGDIRRLFRGVLGLRGDCSERRILSAEGNPAMTIVGGRAPYYRRELAPSTLVKLAETELLFPQLKPFLARSFVSCHAACGEARHINVSTGEIWDMAD